MYHFNKSPKAMSQQIKHLAMRAEQELTVVTQTLELTYEMYIANVSWQVGTLKVTSGIDDCGKAWVNVLAELFDDKGRNNTVAVDPRLPLSSETIFQAIGFTCGSAFWRNTTYR